MVGAACEASVDDGCALCRPPVEALSYVTGHLWAAEVAALDTSACWRGGYLGAGSEESDVDGDAVVGLVIEVADG